MNFSVKDQDSILDMVKRLKTLKVPLEKGLVECAKTWKQAIQEGMENTKRRADGTSEPGGFPAIQSGMLHASFSYNARSWYKAEVGTSISYAPYLEHGTSKMLPRPMIAEQFELLGLKNQFIDLIHLEIEQYLK